MCVTLHTDEVQALKILAERRGESLQKALRRAIMVQLRHANAADRDKMLYAKERILDEFGR